MQSASCLQSTSRAIPSSIHDPPSVEDTTTEGLAYHNDIDQLQQHIASQLEGQDTQTVSAAKSAVQQVVQEYQGTASMPQLIQVRPARLFTKKPITQVFLSCGTQWVLLLMLLRSSPFSPHRVPHVVLSRGSWQAQGQKVLQALVMVHPHTASLEAGVLWLCTLLLSTGWLLPCTGVSRPWNGMAAATLALARHAACRPTEGCCIGTASSRAGQM